MRLDKEFGLTHGSVLNIFTSFAASLAPVCSNGSVALSRGRAVREDQ